MTVHLHDPQTLYRHWEHEQWNPWDIALSDDREQWEHALERTDKELVYWALSSPMVGEERITTKFAGLVIAADNEEEASCLATQQVDEARHMHSRLTTGSPRIHATPAPRWRSSPLTTS